MAGILACFDKVPYHCNVVLGTELEKSQAIMDRFRGQDSAPSVDGLPYRDLQEPLLVCIRRRSAPGGRTIFMKVRAHRGRLLVHEVADEWAAKGHSSVITLGEDREMESDQGLDFTKLTAEGRCSDNPAGVNDEVEQSVTAQTGSG